MARIPTVAIIGRPNVGKSTLFNAIVGERRAIVSSIPGTTRDQVARVVPGRDVDYLLVDTGGIGGGSQDRELESDVAAQSLLAVASANLILFAVDGRHDLTGSDHAVVEILRKRRARATPVILTALKCDRVRAMDSALYHALGIAEDIIHVSAVHNRGIAELRTAIEHHLRALHFHKSPPPSALLPPPARVALIGKPNVGKSSLVNAFMADPDVRARGRLVSPVPGTTRDSSDTVIRRDGKSFVFVDTAGLRHDARHARGIEGLAHMKALHALAQADVAVLVFDALTPTSQQDKRIAGAAITTGTGLILLLNKCDVLRGEERTEHIAELQRAMPFADFAPILAASAKTRINLPKLFSLIETVAANRARHIPTRELRNWFAQAAGRMPARVFSTTKHVTQAAGVPPTFVLFGSGRNITRAHFKFLERNLRSTFDFTGVPLRFIVR